MLRPDTAKRSEQTELMDDFELSGNELRRTLKDLDRINSLLGGNQITLSAVKYLIDKNSPGTVIKIVDVGCGNGAILRKIANWGRKKGVRLNLVGVDANPSAISIAEELSADYPEISYSCLNIFHEDFKSHQYEIVLCTLTLHHFSDEKILRIIEQFYSQSQIGIVINDLHRTKLAYYLFKAFCSVFVKNMIARNDGLISITRGFKKSDIRKYQRLLQKGNHSLSWKWAFRYQWIIEKK